MAELLIYISLFGERTRRFLCAPSVTLVPDIETGYPTPECRKPILVGVRRVLSLNSVPLILQFRDRLAKGYSVVQKIYLYTQIKRTEYHQLRDKGWLQERWDDLAPWTTIYPKSSIIDLNIIPRVGYFKLNVCLHFCIIRLYTHLLCFDTRSIYTQYT